MTIIEPQKNKYYANEFLYIGLLLLVAAMMSIYLYNINVNLKYQLGLQERAIQQLEVMNADLRNKLYSVLDFNNLSALIQKENLVSDKNPDYLENKSLAHR
jgi:hypothetical protein